MTSASRTLWESIRRFAGRWGFASFLLLVAVLFHRVAAPFALALMLAYVLSPLVGGLARLRPFGRAVPRFVAVIVVYLGMLSSLGLFFGLFLPRLSGDLARLATNAPRFFAKVKGDYAPRASAWFETAFPSEEPVEPPTQGPPRPSRIEVIRTAPDRYEISLDDVDLELEPLGPQESGRFAIGPRHTEQPAGRLEDFLGKLARGAEREAMDVLKLGQRFVTGLVQAVARLILILMVGAFLLIDAAALLAFLRRLVPPPARTAWDELIVELDRGVAGVIRGQLIICLVNGLLTYLGLVLLKVKFALLLGALAAAMSMIPVFGSILSSIPIVAVALASGAQGIDLQRGFGTLGWIIGIHLLEANLLNPKIIGGAAKIHPVVVLFALLCGEHMGGLIGALVAVPVASLVQTVFLFFWRRADARWAAEALAAPEEDAPPTTPRTDA